MPTDQEWTDTVNAAMVSHNDLIAERDALKVQIAAANDEIRAHKKLFEMVQATIGEHVERAAVMRAQLRELSDAVDLVNTLNAAPVTDDAALADAVSAAVDLAAQPAP